MSVCICIFDNELEKVAEQLDNKTFKYKFLFDSDEKEKSIKYYNLELLNECLMFTGSLSMFRVNRYKSSGEESVRAWNEVIDLIFSEERHIAIVNDYFDNPNMVIVIPTVFYDSSQRSGNNTITLGDSIMDFIINRIVENLRNDEGMNVVTWNDYTSDIYKESDPDRRFFKETQRRIKEQAKSSYKQEVLDTFTEAFKFRMITYYTKLRDYGLEDIMRKLSDLGYLDERFDNELYLYEEEARRLLAKRLCAISFKNDIEILIQEGIINPNRITYNLNV